MNGCPSSVDMISFSFLSLIWCVSAPVTDSQILNEPAMPEINLSWLWCIGSHKLQILLDSVSEFSLEEFCISAPEKPLRFLIIPFSGLGSGTQQVAQETFSPPHPLKRWTDFFLKYWWKYPGNFSRPGAFCPAKFLHDVFIGLLGLCMSPWVSFGGLWLVKNCFTLREWAPGVPWSSF